MTDNTATDNNLVSIAFDFVESFTTRENNEGDKIYVIKEDFCHYESVREIVYKCHQGKLPDNWIYETVFEILLDISNLDNNYDRDDILDNISINVDHSNYDLKQWFLKHSDYCDLYMENFGSDYTNISELLTNGQWYQKDTILSIILDGLELCLQDRQS